MSEMKMPPNDKEAEKAVLGCALRSRTSLNEIIAKISGDDFYHFSHRKIFEAFQLLASAGKQVDAVTLADQVKQMGFTEDIGGYAYIVDLWDSAPTFDNPDAYVTIVREKAGRRRLMEVTEAIAKMAYDKSLSLPDLYESAERALYEVTQRDYSGRDLVTMPMAVREALENLDRRAQHHTGDELPMGWVDLDRLTGGLKRKELTVVGARPSVGKTLFALNVIENLAMLGKRIFFASIEQGHTELIERMLSRNTSVSSYYFRTVNFTADDRNRITQAAEALEQYQIFIDDNSNQKAARIMSQARRLAAQAKLDLVVVDYLGLMEAEDRREQRYIQVGANCRRMRQLAKELDVPVLLLAQLGRGVDDRGEGARKPRLADLRESGDIEQHADTVLLLHKEEEPENGRPNDKLQVLVRKQRNGPLGEVTLVHRKAYFDLVNLVPEIP